jgi:gluconolactonase
VGSPGAIRAFAGPLRYLVDAEAPIERVATGFQFTEGPLWHPSGNYLLFSDLAGDAVHRWDEPSGVSVFRKPSGKANGLAYDRDLCLIACEHVGRRVTRTAADGSSCVLASEYGGKRLNSPNDVVVAADGAIYFTDPPYGLQDYYGIARPQDLDFQGVYRIGPDGRLALLADDFAAPNGLAFAPDGRRLYVDDTERNHLRVFDVRADGSLANGRLFFDFGRAAAVDGLTGAPDGLKVDAHGNVFCTGPGGVWVLSPGAEPLGLIRLPEQPSNLNWAGPDRSVLYVTAGTSVYCLRTRTTGQLAYASSRRPAEG